MKMHLKYIIFLIVPVVLFACNSNTGEKQGQSRPEKLAKTSLEFTETEFDFGTITSGENVTHRFVFKNTGTADLYISRVAADCGCTIADYVKEAVKPGEEGYVELIFDSGGYHGLQIKKVNVYANTVPQVHELTIAAVVK